MRLFIVLAFLLGLAACSFNPSLCIDQERDGGIGGTGVCGGEMQTSLPVV